ncbi:MAG: hypothetical protein R2728_05570 [Chitinophagales bacterium]
MAVGISIDTFISALGCDSIVTVNTSLLVASFNTISVESCDPSEVGTTVDTLIVQLVASRLSLQILH